MTVSLNHTIVPAADNNREADFFAEIIGLERLPPTGAAVTPCSDRNCLRWLNHVRSTSRDHVARVSAPRRPTRSHRRRAVG